MLPEFQNKTNSEIIGFWLMHFGFALELSEIDLWNIDLLDTDIPSILFVSIIPSRHLQDMSSRRL